MPCTVRHYTNQEGVQGIFHDGVIKESLDSKNGPGLFVTSASLLPTCDVRTILENNYNTVTNKKADRADYYFEFEVNSDRLRRPIKDDRDVLVVDGNVHFSDVNVRLYNTRTGEREPFECSDCERSFKSTRALDQHKREKHSLLECDCCDRSFNDYHVLDQHKRDKHPVTFDCESCDICAHLQQRPCT